MYQWAHDHHSIKNSGGELINKGWQRLSVVGVVIWTIIFVLGVLYDGNDACKSRADDYFAKLLKNEYESHGAVGPNFFGDDYVRQAIATHDKYPLPNGRLDAVIAEASNARYKGSLCSGTNKEAALGLIGPLALIPLIAIFAIFGLVRVYRWVSSGFKNR